VPLVYSDAVAATLFWATFVAWVAIDLQTAVAGVSGRLEAGSSARNRSGRSIRLGLAAIWVGIGAGLAVAAIGSLQLPGAPAFLGLGLVLAWSGLALRLWAKRTPGGSSSPPLSSNPTTRL
jgi:protein-S-isoprenylcysteine O-methyltransferase Ste14